MIEFCAKAYRHLVQMVTHRWTWVTITAPDGYVTDWLLCSKSNFDMRAAAQLFAEANPTIVGEHAIARVRCSIPTWWLAEKIFRIANWRWQRTRKRSPRFVLPGLYLA